MGTAATAASKGSLAGPDNDRANWWFRLGRDISIAGGLFPAAAFATLAPLVGLYAAIADPPAALESGAAIAILMVVALIWLITVGFACSLGWTAFVAAATLPAVWLFLRTAGWRVARDRLARSCGSVVAFLATLPIGLATGQAVSAAGSWGAVLLGAAAVGLAIAMGQAAGLLASIRELQRRRRGRLDEPPHSGRFSVWGLLVATAVVAVALTVLKAANLLTVEMAFASALGATVGVVAARPVRGGVNSWLDRKRRIRRARLASRFT